MKNNLLVKSFLLFSSILSAREGHEEEPHYEWFKAEEIAVSEDGIYTDSHKGMMKLNVVGYDPIQDQYQVKCRCLEDPHLNPCEALALPYEGVQENP